MLMTDSCSESYITLTLCAGVKPLGGVWGGSWIPLSKRVDRNASEHHLNHCHMEKGGSKTHPRPLPAALFQHIVVMGSLSSIRSPILMQDLGILGKCGICGELSAILAEFVFAEITGNAGISGRFSGIPMKAQDSEHFGKSA